MPPHLQANPGALVSLDHAEQYDRRIGPNPSPDDPRGLCRPLCRAMGYIENILSREERIAVGEVSGVRGGQKRLGMGSCGNSCLAGDILRLDFQGSTYNSS